MTRRDTTLEHVSILLGIASLLPDLRRKQAVILRAQILLHRYRSAS